MPTFAPPFGNPNYPSRLAVFMIYIFSASVFITLFLVLGALAIYGFLGLMQSKFPIGWTCYQHVIVLAIIAVVSLIIACLFGAQIPDCYASV